VFGRQVGEAALQRRAPLGVDVVVAGRLVGFQLADEVALGPAELFQLAVQRRPLRGDCRAG
jgi:hypothetical protein